MGKGHGGTPRGKYHDNWKGNNTEFLITLYKAWGKFHDITTDSFINNNNFAINDRCYNPANIENLWSPTTASVEYLATDNASRTTFGIGTKDSQTYSSFENKGP